MNKTITTALGLWQLSDGENDLPPEFAALRTVESLADFWADAQAQLSQGRALSQSDAILLGFVMDYLTSGRAEANLMVQLKERRRKAHAARIQGMMDHIDIAELSLAKAAHEIDTNSTDDRVLRRKRSKVGKPKPR